MSTNPKESEPKPKHPQPKEAYNHPGSFVDPFTQIHKYGGWAKLRNAGCSVWEIIVYLQMKLDYDPKSGNRVEMWPEKFAGLMSRRTYQRAILGLTEKMFVYRLEFREGRGKHNAYKILLDPPKNDGEVMKKRK